MSKRISTPSSGIKCPICGSVTDVIETRNVPGGARRRRRCRERWCEGRIDEVEIDDVSAPQVIESSWGVGSVVRMKVTNVGTVPAHFHAIWRLEDA